MRRAARPPPTTIRPLSGLISKVWPSPYTTHPRPTTCGPEGTPPNPSWDRHGSQGRTSWAGKRDLADGSHRGGTCRCARPSLDHLCAGSTSCATLPLPQCRLSVPRVGPERRCDHDMVGARHRFSCRFPKRQSKLRPMYQRRPGNVRLLCVQSMVVSTLFPFGRALDSNLPQ